MVLNMAKRAGLFRILLGAGAAATAVVLSRKESRDKLKNEYNKYKEDPEGYKANAKEFANDISSKANEKFQDVRSNPQGYVERLKKDPKGFLEEEKSNFSKSEESKEDLNEAKFDEEGGGAPSNNLRVVTEEDLKNNKNQ